MTKEASTSDVLTILLNTLKLIRLSSSKEKNDWEVAISQIREVKKKLSHNFGDEMHAALEKKVQYIVQEGFLDPLFPHILSIAELRKEINYVDLIKDTHEKQNKHEEKVSEKRSLTAYDIEVTIQCRDDGKNLSKNFQCRSWSLLKEMPYFSKAIKGQDLSDVDIKVHCDVNVFDWLIRWIESQQYRSLETPGLEPTNVVPIMVSASFLEMEKLVQLCLNYCHVNIHEVLATTQSFGCVSDELFQRLADMFTTEEILKIERQSIQSRLFSHLALNLATGTKKSNHAIYISANTLFRCTSCSLILTRECCLYVPCTFGKFTALQSGKIVYRHSRDPNWSLDNHLRQLKNELRSWSSIYWYLWGESHYAMCSQCDTAFTFAQYNKCRFHPDSPVYQKHRNIYLPSGRYPCCGTMAYRFHLLPENTGCRSREHKISPRFLEDEVMAKVVDFFLKHKQSILQQFSKMSPYQKNLCSVQIDDINQWGSLERPETRFLVPLPNIPWLLEDLSSQDSRSEGSTSKQTSRQTSAPGSVNSRGTSINSDKGTSRTVSEDVLEEDIRSEEDDDPSPPLIRSVRIPMFKRKNLNPKPLPSYKNTDLRWNPLFTTRANQDNLREFEDNLMFQMACEYHKGFTKKDVFQNGTAKIPGRGQRTTKSDRRAQSAMVTAFAAIESRSKSGK
ncbi:SANT and BTB domain regulator of class switch recombination-like [Artemia franciscana]